MFALRGYVRTLTLGHVTPCLVWLIYSIITYASKNLCPTLLIHRFLLLAVKHLCLYYNTASDKFPEQVLKLVIKQVIRP